MMNKKYLLLSALVFSFGLHAEKIQSIEAYITLHADDNQEAVASYVDASVANRDVLEVAIDVNEEVTRIFNILWEISEDSYARTAVYLSPHVDDLKACQLIAQS